MIRFILRPVLLENGEYNECTAAQASAADNGAFGIYFTGSDKRTMHKQDYATYEEAAVERDRLINDWQNNMHEQVAIFMADVDHNRIPQATMDKLEGFVGLVNLVIAEAAKFCLFHYEAMEKSGDEDYWDNADWFESSEKWFAKEIATELYEDLLA